MVTCLHAAVHFGTQAWNSHIKTQPTKQVLELTLLRIVSFMLISCVNTILLSHSPVDAVKGLAIS